MQGVDAVGQAGVATVHGQGVLRQVVGADGEEVGVFGQLIGEQGGGRHLDHHPEFGQALDPQLRGQLAEAATDGAQFIDLADHRQQYPAAFQWFDPEQRAQLLVEQLRARLAEADAAQAQCWVFFHRQRQVVEVLVAADIDGADDHLALAHGVQDLLVGVALLLFVGRGAALEKEKLGA